MKTRRALFIAVLAALLVTGIAIGNAKAAKPAPVLSAQTSAVLPADGAAAVAFCPGLPPAVPSADTRVTFANAGTTVASLDLTVLPDKGDPTRQHLTVQPHSTLVKRRADIGPAGALTVESFGGRVVVAEGVEGARTTELATCARQTSTQWEFAAGTTPRGAQQWLVIDDPYASDARVDVVLRTNEGVRKPDALQGLDIGRRSRLVISIHDIAVRKDLVAVEVNATIGGVVTAQTLVFNADSGTPGVASTVGARQPSAHWMFSEGIVQSDGSSMLAVANVGSADTDVGVQTLLENGRASAPLQLTLAADAVAWVKFGGCKAGDTNCVPLPDGTRYGIDVRAADGGQIVAQTLSRAPQSASRAGVTTSMGVNDAAPSWVLPRTSVAGELQTTLAVTNPLSAPAKVLVVYAQNNVLLYPGELRAITVPPGRRVTIVVAGENAKTRLPDSALLVTATSPVVVEQLIVTDAESSRMPAVAAG